MLLGCTPLTYHNSTLLGIMPKAQQATNDPFLILTAAQASGEQSTICVHNAAAKIYTEHLVLNSGQKQSISQLYSTPGYIQAIQYRSNDDKDQIAAGAIKRVLYQWYVSPGLQGFKVLTNIFSDCGYDHATAYAKRCQNTVDFTGCLAHAEVTYHADNNIIRQRPSRMGTLMYVETE